MLLIINKYLLEEGIKLFSSAPCYAGTDSFVILGGDMFIV